jgi:branched-chain amino acid transport system substrate-binding protein
MPIRFGGAPWFLEDGPCGRDKPAHNVPNMDDPTARGGSPPMAANDARTGSITRGFLFADLRGYTQFVETHGASAAADVLVRYRGLVRDLVSRHSGAEIRTEGDSFYVVFAAVSDAVQCGLDIVEQARAASVEHPETPIAVGVGIHAGETIETPEGYVGGPVNIAARLCALAGAGEVLVSDTVRALTHTVLSVSFVPRGKKSLKGVTDPVAVYAVVATSERPSLTAIGRLRGLSRGARVAIAIVLVVAVVWVGAFAANALRRGAGLPAGAWKIGVDAPVSGAGAFRGTPIANAVTLAVDDANAAGGIDGAGLTVDVLDDTGSTAPKPNPSAGAANATTMVADPSVVAVVGPAASPVASAEIPITNQGDLLQCSPSTTNPGLTKPRDGALDLRSAFPTRINYIRTAPSDDIQGTALASFVYTDLGAKSTLVIDDAANGRQIADDFSTAYTKLGGTVVRRALNPGDDPASILAPLSAATSAPKAVFFGGFTETGAPGVRAAMVAAGQTAMPFVSWDGIQDGSGADQGSFIQTAGPAAAGSYFSHASFAAPKFDFVSRYHARFGTDPDEYAAAAYACTQVILESLKAVAATAPSADGLRDAVRAYAVDASNRFDTVIGNVGFDANGDSLQQFVTFYKVDMSAADGKGDWVIDKQQDYGPAP